jgi:hypothetical protein
LELQQDKDLGKVIIWARALVRRGLYQVYNIIPISREWLIVKYLVNVAWGSLLGFYIFNSERITNDYIRHCKLRTCMEMQAKAWMMTLLFKELL